MKILSDKTESLQTFGFIKVTSAETNGFLQCRKDCFSDIYWVVFDL